MWQYNYNNELYHHGIKGQKWGVRRYRNKDGSLTPAGKKRYGDNDQSTEKQSKKSNHRLSLEDKYRAKGLSDKEAEAAADKRIKIEKAIAITAGVTVAACTAYYLRNKYIADRTDQILRAGTTFHNLDNRANPRPGEHLYVNYRQNDRNFFNGQFALGKLKRSGHVFEHRIEAIEDVKIPSLKMRQSVFKQLCEKDPEFRKAMSQHSGVSENASAKKIYNKMWRKFGDKDTPYFNEAKAKYFKALKERGYAAIVDEWDTKREVYRSDAPLILLDTSHKSLGKMTIRELKANDILVAQANSHSYKFKNDLLNAAHAPHTNHFKESTKTIKNYIKKSDENRLNIETALFRSKYEYGLFGNPGKNVKTDALKMKGKELAYVGEVLNKNKNMTLKEATEIARTKMHRRYVAESLATLGTFGVSTYGGAYAFNYGKDTLKIDKYRAEHPNSKMSDIEILEKLKYEI